MASVSNLDQDVRKLRLDRYTPGAANEVRSWIEAMLGERLAAGDLMEALKDGIALCKLVNRAVSPGVKYKASNMPFVQMENIAHFLAACEAPPLNLPSHDRFLTVDLYDGKDPAQVLQCIAAFSRRANAINPANFPYALGGSRMKSASMSPQGTGSSSPGARSPAGSASSFARPRGTSAAKAPADTPPTLAFNSINRSVYTDSGRKSPVKPSSSLARGGLATPGGSVSSWSKKDDEGTTAPAWNIHQYGYMGGASQGSLGVTFGGRRQLTTPAPEVPSLAEKEKRLREKAEQEQREAEERARREQEQREAEAELAREQARLEEEQARREEERRWEEETRRLREQEQRQQQQQLKLEREAAATREREEAEAKKRDRQRSTSDARLNGQFLSQYQAGQARAEQTRTDQHSINAATAAATATTTAAASSEAKRIAELERQLEELKAQQQKTPSRDAAASAPAPAAAAAAAPTSHEDDWAATEREYLRNEWSKVQTQTSTPSRPLPVPKAAASSISGGNSASAYQPGTTRTGRFLASNPAPVPSTTPATHIPAEHAHSSTAESDAEATRRHQSQQATRAGGWASKSLLEREMERERQRQREWEEAQKETAAAGRDLTQGSKPGQSWDVNQYGYMGGDNQNRGGAGLGGLGSGTARRQLIGTDPGKLQQPQQPQTRPLGPRPPP